MYEEEAEANRIIRAVTADTDNSVHGVTHHYDGWGAALARAPGGPMAAQRWGEDTGVSDAPSEEDAMNITQGADGGAEASTSDLDTSMASMKVSVGVGQLSGMSASVAGLGTMSGAGHLGGPGGSAPATSPLPPPAPVAGQSLRDQAISHAQRAVAADHRGEYAEALARYLDACECFQRHLRKETNPKAKEIIVGKLKLYLDRAEVLKTALAMDGQGGEGRGVEVR